MDVCEKFELKNTYTIVFSNVFDQNIISVPNREKKSLDLQVKISLPSPLAVVNILSDFSTFVQL